MNRRSIPLISRDGSVRPHESSRAARRPLATSEPASTAAIEPRDVLGRVLEVAVHRHDDLAAGAREARVHRRVLAEVPLEADDANPFVAPRGAPRALEAAVGRAVVDEDQLERVARRLERRARAPVELVQRPGLVQQRHDHGDTRVGRRQFHDLRHLQRRILGLRGRDRPG